MKRPGSGTEIRKGKNMATSFDEIYIAIAEGRAAIKKLKEVEEIIMRTAQYGLTSTERKILNVIGVDVDRLYEKMEQYKETAVRNAFEQGKETAKKEAENGDDRTDD